MSARYYRWLDVEMLAARLHQQWSALCGEPIELPIDVDALGEQLLGLSWLYEPIPEPPGTTILAALHPELRLVVLNERHVEVFGRNEGLERFTKAHELGHWVLHAGADGGRETVDGGRQTVDGGRETVDGGRQTVDGGRQAPGAGRLPSGAGPGPMPRCDTLPYAAPLASAGTHAEGVWRLASGERCWQEKQANWFAAALLLPPQPLRQAAAEVDVTTWRGRYTLREQCGVSISALNARLRQLGYPLPIG